MNQGCLISLTIYLGIGELLALRLRNHDHIKGINIGNTEMLISPFADCMDLYLPFEKTVLNSVIEVLDHMELAMGLKVSYDKTIIYRIGSLANTDAKIITKRQIRWSNEAINTLAIELHNKKELYKNFEKVILRMETVMNMWYYRTLTLIGKVLILNSLISSLFVYKMQVLPEIPESLWKKITESYEHFLWNGKKPKIKLSVLMCSKQNGGLGLANLQLRHKSILLSWINHVKENSIISELANYFTDNLFSSGLLWKLNLNAKDAAALKIENAFWKQVVISWCEFNFYNPQSAENIRSQSIYGNSNIKVGGSVLWPPKNARITCITINDLLNSNTKAFKSFDQVHNSKCRTNLDWLTFHSIIAVIPGYWKCAFFDDDLQD